MVGTPGEEKGARGAAEPRPRGRTKARVRRWREETRVGWCLRISIEAAAASGGLWEEPGQSPTWSKISSTTSGWSMKAIIRRASSGRGSAASGRAERHLPKGAPEPGVAVAARQDRLVEAAARQVVQEA